MSTNSGPGRLMYCCLSILSAGAVVASGTIGAATTVAVELLLRHPAPQVQPPPPPAPQPVRKRKKLTVLSMENCPWCDKLRTAMNEQGVRDALEDYEVAEVKGQASPSGYPTMVVTDGSGKELGRHPGYMEPAKLAKWLRSFR